MKFYNFFKSIALLSIVLLSFSACNNNDDNTPPPPPERSGPYKEGVFMVMEGSPSKVGGLMFMEYGFKSIPTFSATSDIYSLVNPGHSLGTLLEDIYIVGEDIYLLSQKGSVNSGDGQLVIADAYTMESKSVINNITFANNSDAPQHLVVVGDKAYIQYAEGEVETHSGIKVYDLKNKTFATTPIEGTYGEFTKQGAIKGRMLQSRGKIYAACGENLVIIDPATDKVIKTVTYAGRQIKDIVKGYDSNLYMTVSGTYTVNGLFATPTSTSKVVAIDHSGNAVSEFELPAGLDLPVLTWAPTTATCASMTEHAIYFSGNYDDQLWCVNDIYKFEYKTKKLIKVDLAEETGSVNGVLGYMCVEPKTNRLIVPIQGATFAVFEASTMAFIEYDEENLSTIVFCAGVDCTSRFANSYINR